MSVAGVTEELAHPAGPAPLDLDVVLSGEWLTAALGRCHAGIRVTGARQVERLDTIATKVRFSVGYEDRAGHAVPDALCVKGYFADDAQVWASLGSREARFYGELEHGLGVNVPRCLYAGIDPGSRHGVVVMEDLVASGTRFLTALSPYSADQVAATLDQLAVLHAARWADVELAGASWLDPTFAGYAQAVPEDRHHELLDGPRGEGVPPDVRDPRRLRAALGALAERVDGRPSCLVHADAHAGNLYEDPTGRPGLVDWQMYQRSCWSLDVAYHLGAVLDPSERKRTERDLLAHYLSCLGARAVPVPQMGEAWDDYRASLAYGYFLWSITQRVVPEVTVAMNQRLGVAVAENEALEVLGV